MSDNVSIILVNAALIARKKKFRTHPSLVYGTAVERVVNKVAVKKVVRQKKLK